MSTPVTNKLHTKQRKLKAFLFGVMAVLCAFFLPSLYRSYVLPSAQVEALMSKVAAAEQSKVTQQLETWRKQQTKLTEADAQRQWKNLRAKMQLTGASIREIDNVLHVIRNTGVNGRYDPAIFICPTYARRGVVNNCPVWIIECAWEYYDKTTKSVVAPMHYWRVAVWGQWPYSILASERCL